jgi:hypothetical protein
MTAAVDLRVITPSMSITVATLVTVWADHTPTGEPIPETCRTCGHSYLTDGPLCPTARIVRPLLQRRRHEARTAGLLAQLTTHQEMDLIGLGRLSTDTAFANTRFNRLINAPVAARDDHQEPLFPTNPTHRHGGTR